MQGHTSRMNSVVFSPDGGRIISGSDDSKVWILDAEAGNPVGEPFQGHRDWVKSVAFSPDGECVVSGSDDGTIRIWDAETGEQVGEPFQGHTAWVTSVAFSPNGKRVVSGSDKTVRDLGCGNMETGGRAISRTRKCGNVCCILSEWKARRLGLVRHNNSDLECRGSRGSGKAIKYPQSSHFVLYLFPFFISLLDIYFLILRISNRCPVLSLINFGGPQR